MRWAVSGWLISWANAADICPSAASLADCTRPSWAVRKVPGAGFDQLFKFFTVTLAQAAEAPALAEKQPQKHQGQPQTSGGQAALRWSSKATWRFAQQVQGPAFGFEWQGAPQIVRIAVRALDAGQ
jgi:hypothetical protein